MPHVVYILAHSRSGSTLLARMLGQVEGWRSVGEVRYLWGRGLVENQPCGCGQPFEECAFWRAVVDEAFGEVARTTATNMAALVRSADRVWRMEPLGAHWIQGPKAASRRTEALQLLSRLYLAIETVSGASVIVDSSKSPSYAHLLSLAPGVRVRVVHLVRDGRGVAYSRLRRLARGELRSKNQHLLVARTALEWAAVNGLAHRLGTELPYTLVKYEDLLADPRATLQRIAVETQSPAPSFSFLGDSTVLLGADHIVSGNQMRFERGWLPLRPDDEWRHELTRMQLLILRAFTFPWMQRYGYK